MYIHEHTSTPYPTVSGLCTYVESIVEINFNSIQFNKMDHAGQSLFLEIPTPIRIQLLRIFFKKPTTYIWLLKSIILKKQTNYPKGWKLILHFTLIRLEGTYFYF